MRAILRWMTIWPALLVLGGVLVSAVHAEAPTPRTITVTTVCLLDDGPARALDPVLEAVAAACRRASNDLVVAPYTPFLSFRSRQVAEDLAGFARLAAENHTYLSLALREKEGERTYATSVLFDRQGKPVFQWRKTHAFPDDDELTLGDKLDVYRCDFGVIAATISTDIYFPEVYEVLRMKGAEILLWQHFPERLRDHSAWGPLSMARSFDSHACLVTAMYADPRTYITHRHALGMPGAAWGRSMILNRVGVPVADTGYEEGHVTAVLHPDRRKRDIGDGWERGENIFYVNCMGDRTAFRPVAEPWRPPVLPQRTRRTARIAVIAMDPAHMWRTDKRPARMLELLDEAAEAHPDLVLLSEMSARRDDPEVAAAMAAVAERARKMKAYICIGGLQDEGSVSTAHIWDRQGRVVYTQPIYWTHGFPELKVLDTDFARIACHTCGDLYTPMLDRTLMLKGAELILDPSQMWGPDGRVNETLLRARALDNAVWMACAHWNTSDPSLRSLIIDPYGQVVAASRFQHEGVIWVDIDFDDLRVYYAGRKAEQPTVGKTGIASYFRTDLPAQRRGWRTMMLARRRPELYGIIPTVNEVIRRYRPETNPFDKAP